MLNPLEMERYIAATARRADLNVKWEDGAEHPRTDGKTVWLPSMAADVTPKQYKRLRHFVTHEVDHVLYSDVALLKETGLNPSNSLLGAVWNGIEDHRIDYLGGQEYEGDRLNANDVYGELTDRLVNSEHIKAAKAECENKMVNGILPVLAYTNRLYTDFYPSAHRAQQPLEEAMSEEAAALYQKFLSGGYDDELCRLRKIADPKAGTAATLELAKRMYEEVYDGDAEQEMERVKQEQEKQKGQGERGDGTEEGDEEGQQAEGGGKGEEGAEADSKEAQGEDNDAGDKPDGKVRDKWANVDYRPMMHDAHSSDESPKEGMHLNYSNYKNEGTGRRPARQDEFEVRDYTNGSQEAVVLGGYGSTIASALAHTSPGFAHKVRTILQIRARDRYQYGLKCGHLNTSSLYRVTMTEASGFNERVFKKKTTSDVLDAAVTLVVDGSGSMSGAKYTHAAAAAVMLNDVVGNTLHIPVEILSYTTTHAIEGGVRIDLHRTHKDKLLSKNDLITRFDAAGRSMSGNDDGDAIVWAFDRLVQRKERRKLMVVFSDGSPAGHGTRGDIVWYTRHVIKCIEDDSPVDIVGIGIEDDNVTMFYKENQVIHKASDLEPALLAVIEGKLK